MTFSNLSTMGEVLYYSPEARTLKEGFRTMIGSEKV